MTLPYIRYRSPVWIVLCRAVNSFCSFLMIFWKVPVIVAQAPLHFQIGSTFTLAPIRFSPCYMKIFFLFYRWVIAARMLMIFLCIWCIDAFLLFPTPSATPQSPAHTSETSAERLALACERVHADNAMHYVFTAFVWNAATVILASL